MMQDDDDFRSRIVASARRWIGTPYRHQASRFAVGCDCLGLVRGIWRDIYQFEPEQPPPYAPDWAEATKDDPLMAAARRILQPAPSCRAGSIILFRWRNGMAAKHLGIATGEGTFIHAYERMAVTESPLIPHWRKRIAGLFDFPVPRAD